MYNNPSLRARVFYLMRRYDVELAETFARRCPEVQDVVELNTFFHRIFSQIDGFPFDARACLNDTMNEQDWFRHFEATALPALVRLRFPPFTAKEVPSFYDILNPGLAPA